MLLTVTSEDDALFSVEIGEGDTVAALKQQLEALSGIAAAAQELWHHNQKLESRATLQASGVSADDLILLRKLDQPGPQQQPGGLSVEGIARELRSNPQIMSQLPPDLRTALQTNDPRLAELLGSYVQQIQQRQQQQQGGGFSQAEIDEMNANEFNPEYQQRIAERIHQEAINANYETAMEHTPEVFTSVFMLYVKMMVNGQPIKAFVDSGAQRCVMSQACAERVHISHLIDKRFSGMAQGVGTTKIVGQIHAVPVDVGGQVVPMSIHVLESDNMDFLFGLDMMKRYKCSIDLATNCLRFGALDNVELKFLAEHELPDDARHGRPLPAVEGGSSRSAAEAAGSAAAARATAGNVTPGQVAGAPDTAARSAANAPVAVRGGGAPSASVPASAPGAAAPAVASGAGQPTDLEAKIMQLQGLGFSRPECIQALNACGGDVDHAAALLFS